FEAKLSAIKEETKQRFLSEVSKLRTSLFSRMAENSRDVTSNDQCYRATSVDSARAIGDPETLADRELQRRQPKTKEIDTAKRTADSSVVIIQQELDVLERIMLNAMEQSLFEGNLKMLLVGMNGLQDKPEMTNDCKVTELRRTQEVLPRMDFN